MTTKPEVYEGDRDYMFIGYAHEDEEIVLPMIEALVAAGYRVWYDDGIEISAPYPDYIANHVYGCACFVALLSTSALHSEWCNQEINYAIDLNRQILPIYIEEVELSRGLQMRIGNRQALYWYEYDTNESFYNRLFRARILESCHKKQRKKSEEAGQRGREKRGDRDIEDVRRRSVLSDYTWKELKNLSQAIAKAGSSAEWMEIVRTYGLVEDDGKLKGASKPLRLKDGTETSVRILGFRHDELVNGDKAGITFEFTDVPVTHHMNPGRTNRGGWERSAMRAWLNKGFMSMLPDDLQLHVELAKKLSNNRVPIVGESDARLVSITNDRLWLLSVAEVYSETTTAYRVEGMQYQLYADYNDSASANNPCKKRGRRAWWWLRSQREGDTEKFRGVSGRGDWSATYADNKWGVSPGFCF